MKIRELEVIGKVHTEKAPVKTYRSNPGDLTISAIAALYYAKKNNSDMVLVAGNSYGQSVYHIALPTDDLRRYTVMKCEADVFVVKINGEVVQGKAM